MIKEIISEVEFKRLDHYLVEILKLNRSQITALIKDGLVLVNGKVIKPGFTLSIGDKIVVNLASKEELDPLKPVKLPLDIIYEDDELIVINKPKGLVVHPSNTFKETTLVSGLLYHTNRLSQYNQDPFRPGILHRIDKDTSGLLLVTKTDKAHKILASDLKKHAIKREYQAIVQGVLEHKEGVIDVPIGRHEKVRTKMAATPHGKHAVTHFNVLKTFKNHTLLHLKLETGRTHQIRVHLAYIGHPIVGDPLYGPKSNVLDSGQLLHAFKLEFVHPITKKVMALEAPLPPTFINYLNELS